MLKFVIHLLLFLLAPNISSHNIVNFLHHPIMDSFQSLDRCLRAIMAHKEVNRLCIRMHVQIRLVLRAPEPLLAAYTDPAPITKHDFNVNIQLIFNLVFSFLSFDLLIDFLHRFFPRIMNINDISYHFDYLSVINLQAMLCDIV